jgi:tRNA C32,U32 (ribose-2'-O)-methylase TrmJ
MATNRMGTRPCNCAVGAGMSKVKEATMRLSTSIQEGYDLLEEFQYQYKRFEEMLRELPASRKNEKAEATKLMQELAAHSRDLKQEIKNANAIFQSINGHIAWKAAVRDCFGEEGLQKCYDYFEDEREKQE